MAEFPATSPHLHAGPGVAGMMLAVAVALVPGVATSVWFYGWGIIINIGIAVAAAVLAETLMLRLRRRPVATFVLDGSALVTGLLLALALPPLVPWWIPVVAVVFAIVFAKQLYGGLGYNPFNPAMVGYAVVLIAFPLEMTRWPALTSLTDLRLSFTETLNYVSAGQLPPNMDIDALTAATPLDHVRTQLTLGQTVPAILRDAANFGWLGGRGSQWINAAFLLGGLWLIYKRVITWRIPAAVLAGLGGCAALFWLVSAQQHAPPLFHLFSGATMLGAFFIATDPVTASTTQRGRLWYGAGCGLLIYLIRAWGGYPDGVAFAVLLMNMAAPTIDHFTRPAVYGHGKDADG
jgi:electron transport complex protein RnfD